MSCECSYGNNCNCNYCPEWNICRIVNCSEKRIHEDISRINFSDVLSSMSEMQEAISSLCSISNKTYDICYDQKDTLVNIERSVGNLEDMVLYQSREIKQVQEAISQQSKDICEIKNILLAQISEMSSLKSLMGDWTVEEDDATKLLNETN